MEVKLTVLFVLANVGMVCLLPAGTFVDLTHPFDDTTLGFPGEEPFSLKFAHYGPTDPGYWLQTEDYSSATHVGTHMDAPCHIVRGQWSLEDIPIERFMGPAAVVDISFRTKRDRDANLEVEDLKAWEKRNGRSLNGTIVLVSTGWSKKWGDKKAFLGTDTGDVSKVHFPGVSEAAAEWVAQHRQIYALGIDTTSLDNGQAVQRRAHEALFRKNIYGMENVAELHRMPEYIPKLLVLPMRIKEACGAPVRIVAQLPVSVSDIYD